MGFVAFRDQKYSSLQTFKKSGDAFTEDVTYVLTR